MSADVKAVRGGTPGRRPVLCVAVTAAIALGAPVAAEPQSTAKPPSTAKPQSAAKPQTIVQKTYGTPEQAAEALIAASETFDLAALKAILGPDGMDLVETGDAVHDKNQSQAFAAQARVKHRLDRDPAAPNVAILVIGEEDYPTPIPIAKAGTGWRFDTKAGREELLYRRIGRNELDAIEVCRGYVEAQDEYASDKHDGSRVNQYAQRIISTPGKQDGLAWQDAKGEWQGPIGESIARVIAEGYSSKIEPYHGYLFKILKGQGPAAPFGAMDFLVKGVMIGGFALVAAPSHYAVTGVKTFIVSHGGVVYEKDLGPNSVEQFKTMTRFNPDPTWHPVEAP